MKKVVFFTMFAVLLATGSALAFSHRTIIKPDTAAATYEIGANGAVNSSLQLLGALSGDEEITLQRCVTWTNSTTCASWETLEIDGSAVSGLSDTNHIITLYGGARLRVNKPETAAAAGVEWVQ